MPETVFHEEITEEIKQNLEEQKKPALKEEQKQETKTEIKPEQKQEKKQETKSDPPEVHIEKLNAALRENREEAKRLREERKRDSEKLASLEQGWNKFQEALKKNEAPSYEKDPLENLRLEKERLSKEVEDLKGFRKSHEETVSRQTQMQRFQEQVRSQVYEFESRTPDYNDAFTHVVEVEKSRLEALGVAPENIPQALGAWEAQTAALALRNGKNPGEVIYQLAQRLGYKAQGGEKKQEKSLEDLKRVSEGQEASKSLSGGGGEAELSLESLAMMDEEQLTSFVTKNWSKLAKAQK